MARFITDMGENISLTASEGDGRMEIGRYGVWDDQGRRKPEVIATGTDLEALQEEHGPGLPVHTLHNEAHPL
jgi:hypothetical protein